MWLRNIVGECDLGILSKNEDHEWGSRILLENEVSRMNIENELSMKAFHSTKFENSVAAR